MSIKFTTLLAVLIALLACARAHAERRHKLTRPVHRFAPNRPYLAGKRIVGGFVIDISDAPYQISLQYDDDHNCGGSILSSKWILTAAHCINDNAPSKPTVRVGSSEHASGGTVVRVARIVPHPMHGSKNNYDIALLELKNELTFSEKVQPIALPEQDEPIEEGTMGIVSGWGLTLSEADSNDVLRATNVPTVNQQECNKAYQSRYGGITDQMFCAGYKQGGQDTCRQDSGGPFVAQGRLIGVISWGHECALAGYPGVYARVASARDWIRTTSGV